LQRSGGSVGNGCCQVGQQQQRGSGNNSERKIGRKGYNQPATAVIVQQNNDINEILQNKH